MNDQNGTQYTTEQQTTTEQQPQPQGYQQPVYQQPQYQQPMYQQPQMQYQQQPQPQQFTRPMRWYKAYKIISLIQGILDSIGVFSLLIMVLIFSVFGSFVTSSMQLAEGVLEMQMLLRAMNIIMWPSLVITIVSMILAYTIYSGLKSYRRKGLIAVYIQAVWNILAPLIIIPVMYFYMHELFSFINFLDPSVVIDKAIIDIVVTGVAVGCIIGAMITAVLYTINAIYFRKRKDVFR